MTTIGRSFHITGEITSEEAITVHGRIDGRIVMQDGALVIAAGGHVDADVEGGAVLVHGTLAGNVVAADCIELADTAEVTGTLISTSVVIAEGAVFNGLVEVQPMFGAARPARSSDGVSEPTQH